MPGSAAQHTAVVGLAQLRLGGGLLVLSAHLLTRANHSLTAILAIAGYLSVIAIGLAVARRTPLTTIQSAIALGGEAGALAIAMLLGGGDAAALLAIYPLLLLSSALLPSTSARWGTGMATLLSAIAVVAGGGHQLLPGLGDAMPLSLVLTTLALLPLADRIWHQRVRHNPAPVGIPVTRLIHLAAATIDDDVDPLVVAERLHCLRAGLRNELARIDSGNACAPHADTSTIVSLRHLLNGCIEQQTSAGALHPAGIRFEADPSIPDEIRVAGDRLRELFLEIMAAADRSANLNLQLEFAEVAESPHTRILRIDCRFHTPDQAITAVHPLRPGMLLRTLCEHLQGHIVLTRDERILHQWVLEIPVQLPPAAELAQPDYIALPAQRIMVLSADDDTSAHLSKMIGTWGCQVTAESLPARALIHLAEANQRHRPVHTLILDQRGMVPEPNAFARMLKADAALDQTQIILLAHQHKKDPVDSSQFANVLSFPVDKTVLFHALQQPRHAVATRIPQLFDRYLQERSGLPPLEILVGVADTVQRKVVASVLRKANHHSYLTENADQTLDALTTHHFDLILLDAQLPGMDVADVVCLYRLSQAHTNASPVIVMTADDTTATRIEFQRAGVAALLPKPFEPRQLLQTLERVIKLGQDPAAAGPQLFETTGGLLTNTADHAMIDQQTLLELERLGSGLAFVEELIDSFLHDIADLLQDIRNAVDQHRFKDFRDLTYSIRGSAGGVGASALYQVAVRATGISDKEFTATATAICDELDHCREQTRTALLTFLHERRTQIQHH